MKENKKMDFDQICINTIRFLCADSVEKAKSGHPGAPMGLSPLMYVLWKNHLKFNPENPEWFNRDRFILSAGHASILLYSMLHLSGYDLSLDDLKSFRQLHSKTPGHPEFGVTKGVEATTGPLGQGFANGIGIAIAEKILSTRFNHPNIKLIDHYTYSVVSDGDLMEGITSEAASLAGTLQLGKIIYIYDKNNISIDGSTDLTFKEDVASRFLAYGWDVQKNIDANNIEEIDKSIERAKKEASKPSLIIINSQIGYGSPNKAGKESAHGEPLGEEEVELTRKNLQWKYKPFEIPKELNDFKNLCTRNGKNEESKWKKIQKKFQLSFPIESNEFNNIINNNFPENWDSLLREEFNKDVKEIATRSASSTAINAISEKNPNFVGGSADLAASNKTTMNNKKIFQPNTPDGTNLYFGIREHAMGGIVSGISLHKGLIPFAATFLVFSDYMRPAIRLAALSNLQVIYVFTHDSIGLGEDGPTHQPISHLLSLRSIPNLTVIRPSDYKETLSAWHLAMKRKSGPTALILTRQDIDSVSKYSEIDSKEGLYSGGYTIYQKDKSIPPELIIISTGSEVSLSVRSAMKMSNLGINIRVVSMPSWEIFLEQPKSYQDSVLPNSVKKRVSVEAGTTIGWDRFVGSEGKMIGVDRFGFSAPGKIVMDELGFSEENIINVCKSIL